MCECRDEIQLIFQNSVFCEKKTNKTTIRVITDKSYLIEQFSYLTKVIFRGWTCLISPVDGRGRGHG